jgi:hypothetical protein
MGPQIPKLHRRLTSECLPQRNRSIAWGSACLRERYEPRFCPSRGIEPDSGPTGTFLRSLPCYSQQSCFAARIFLTTNGRETTRIHILIRVDSCPFAVVFPIFGCGYVALCSFAAAQLFIDAGTRLR